MQRSNTNYMRLLAHDIHVMSHTIMPSQTEMQIRWWIVERIRYMCRELFPFTTNTGDVGDERSDDMREVQVIVTGSCGTGTYIPSDPLNIFIHVPNTMHGVLHRIYLKLFGEPWVKPFGIVVYGRTNTMIGERGGCGGGLTVPVIHDLGSITVRITISHTHILPTISSNTIPHSIISRVTRIRNVYATCPWLVAVARIIRLFLSRLCKPGDKQSDTCDVDDMVIDTVLCKMTRRAPFLNTTNTVDTNTMESVKSATYLIHFFRIYGTPVTYSHDTKPYTLYITYHQDFNRAYRILRDAKHRFMENRDPGVWGPPSTGLPVILCIPNTGIHTTGTELLSMMFGTEFSQRERIMRVTWQCMHRVCDRLSRSSSLSSTVLEMGMDAMSVDTIMLCKSLSMVDPTSYVLYVPSQSQGYGICSVD